jgi:hypothetical protein
MEIARHWRLRAQRYRLAGAECPACGQRMFPPRALCPQCAAVPGELFPAAGSFTTEAQRARSSLGYHQKTSVSSVPLW